MSKEEILSYFVSNGESFNISKTCIVLLIGLMAGLVIYVTYYLTCDKVIYNRKFNWSLVFILLITDLIMMEISSNIAISLGMVGALSIVRFRTAIKDSRDTVFIFWAIAEGLCVGAQSYRMVAGSVLIIALIMIVTSKLPGLSNKYILIITGDENKIDTDVISSRLREYTVSSRIKTANKNKEYEEYIFEIKTKGELKLNVINELLNINGVKSANFVAETGETLG